MASEMGVPTVGNGRARSPAQRALHRHADEAMAWMDTIEDADTLGEIVDEQLALVTHGMRRLRMLRSTTASRATDEDADDWIGIEDLARLIHRSVSWIRHQPPDAIPGRRQHVAGGRVEWSRRRVQAWLDAYTAKI